MSQRPRTARAAQPTWLFFKTVPLTKQSSRDSIVLVAILPINTLFLLYYRRTILISSSLHIAQFFTANEPRLPVRFHTDLRGRHQRAQYKLRQAFPKLKKLRNPPVFGELMFARNC